MYIKFFYKSIYDKYYSQERVYTHTSIFKSSNGRNCYKNYEMNLFCDFLIF